VATVIGDTKLEHDAVGAKVFHLVSPVYDDVRRQRFFCAALLAYTARVDIFPGLGRRVRELPGRNTYDRAVGLVQLIHLEGDVTTHLLVYLAKARTAVQQRAGEGGERVEANVVDEPSCEYEHDTKCYNGYQDLEAAE